MLALEFASGTGAHLEVFAQRFPKITWQPSEYVPDDLPEGDVGRLGTRDGNILEAIDSVGAMKFVQNVKRAVALDLSRPFDEWPRDEVVAHRGQFDFCFGSNITHITEFSCTQGMLEGSSKALCEGGGGGGILCLYGPFKLKGQFTGDGGNERFDASLRLRNSSWGIRDVELVEQIAKQHMLVLKNRVDMPANNFLLCFRKESIVTK